MRLCQNGLGHPYFGLFKISKSHLNSCIVAILILLLTFMLVTLVSIRHTSALHIYLYIHICNTNSHQNTFKKSKLVIEEWQQLQSPSNKQRHNNARVVFFELRKVESEMCFVTMTVSDGRLLWSADGVSRVDVLGSSWVALILTVAVVVT